MNPIFWCLQSNNLCNKELETKLRLYITRWNSLPFLSFFLLWLQVNNGDVELERNIMDGEPFCHTSENPFYVHLLRNEKPNDQMLPYSSKKRAKSPKGCAKTHTKNSSKENQPVVNTSPSLSTSSCRLSTSQGKPVGSRCTPEGKKRRKSRFVEQVNLPSPRWHCPILQDGFTFLLPNG